MNGRKRDRDAAGLDDGPGSPDITCNDNKRRKIKALDIAKLSVVDPKASKHKTILGAIIGAEVPDDLLDLNLVFCLAVVVTYNQLCFFSN